MGPEFSPKMAVKSLTSQQIVRIHQLFRQAKFDDPSGDVSYKILIVLLLFGYQPFLLIRLVYLKFTFQNYTSHLMVSYIT